MAPPDFGRSVGRHSKKNRDSYVQLIKAKCFLVSYFNRHHILNFFRRAFCFLGTDLLACQKRMKMMSEKLTYQEQLDFNCPIFSFKVFLFFLISIIFFLPFV